MTKPWSQLPNARHIDWVFQSSKNRHELWTATWTAARTVAMDAAWNASWDADRLPAWDAVFTVALAITREAARDALAALVAYDDCDQYLQMTYEQLQVYAILSERPQAVLLLPMKWVQEHEHKCLVTTT